MLRRSLSHLLRLSAPPTGLVETAASLLLLLALNGARVLLRPAAGVMVLVAVTGVLPIPSPPSLPGKSRWQD